LNTEGAEIGKHKGALFYTIGERRGFDVTEKGPGDKQFYVVAKDMKTNTITVSNDEQEIAALSPKKVLLKEVNWITEPDRPELTARIRYRGEKLPVRLSLVEKKLAVEFTDPQKGLSLGQSIVFYDSDRCLGGAVMDRVIA
jgi:tRNA-specific 2-thiouridylase